MSQPRYRLVVNGELGPRYASAFDGMTIHARDGETEITGAIIDQAHLQALLGRIGSLGLSLRSVTPMETENAVAVPRAHVQPAGVRDDDPGAPRKGP
jgi:hypothetical protein